MDVVFNIKLMQNYVFATQPSTYTCLETFLQYDSYGRLSSSYSNSYLNTLGAYTFGMISPTNFAEANVLTYDLADNVLTKTRTNKPNTSTTHTITETMNYDNALRLKRVKHQVDAMPAHKNKY